MNEIAKPARPDLVDKIEALAEELNATPEEIETAAREYAEQIRWELGMVQEAVDEEAAGAPTRDAEEVFDELEARLEERIRARHGQDAAE